MHGLEVKDIKMGAALDFIWDSHDSGGQFLQEDQQSFTSLHQYYEELCPSMPSSKCPTFQLLLLCFF